MAPPRLVSRQGYELQWATNHLGHMALTTALLPLMEGQANARVVTVTSGAQYFGRIAWDDPNGEQRYDRWQAYGQSKLANVMFALELISGSRRQLCAVVSCPSRLARTNRSQPPRERIPEEVAYRLMDPLLQSAAMGALPQLHAATALSAQGASTTARMASRLARLAQTATRSACGPRCSQRQRLWALSELCSRKQ